MLAASEITSHLSQPEQSRIEMNDFQRIFKPALLFHPVRPVQLSTLSDATEQFLLPEGQVLLSFLFPPLALQRRWSLSFCPAPYFLAPNSVPWWSYQLLSFPWLIFFHPALSHDHFFMDDLPNWLSLTPTALITSPAAHRPSPTRQHQTRKVHTELEYYPALYEFPRAVMTRLPWTWWLKTTQIYPLTVLEAVSLKSRCWQCCAPLNVLEPPLAALGGPHVPWFMAVQL